MQENKKTADKETAAENDEHPVPNEKMTQEEIKSRLSARAFEYFMFMDDDDCGGIIRGV